MLLKYSFTYGRKDEYKDCYYNLKASYEKEKQKLKQIIDYKLALRKMESADERSTELLIEFNNMKIRHEAELYNLRKNHEKEMKEEKEKKELMEKSIVSKDTEIK